MTNWPFQSQHQQTSLCICLTGQFQENLRVMLENALIDGSVKASLDCQRACMPHKLLLVRKKTREIQLFVDYQKLNSIVVRDAFPVTHIDEAPQAVHCCQCFMPLDLVQGYLQMPVEEADIYKTAFRAESSDLYEFTHLPFGLSNSRSSFCHLIEMCLGDQQFDILPLLMYLDDICVFATSIDKMLDHIELVFKQLEEFNLKIKLKKMSFLPAQHSLPWACTISRGYICNLQTLRR